MIFSNNRYALAIDLGGTKTAFGIMGIEGDFVHIEKYPTPVQNSTNILDFLLYHIRMIIKEYSDLKIEGIGLSTGGVVDPESGTIIHATSLLPGWQGTPIKQIIEENIGLKANVDNDGNMAALGEYLFGSAKGKQQFVFIAIGTGIGGGAVIDGKVFKGSRGAAMNIGHICVKQNGKPCNCGKRGCLEAYASGRAIETTYMDIISKQSEQKSFTSSSAQEIFQILKKGDAIAKEVIDHALDYLSIGISNIIELFDPDAIVLGGGVSESLVPMLDDFRSRIFDSTRLFNTEMIMISILGSKAALLGAGGSILFEHKIGNQL